MKKTVLVCAMLALSSQSAAWADCSTFLAIPSSSAGKYTATWNGNSQEVDLANLSRTFDFGGAVPIKNPSTNTTDIATINLWDPVIAPRGVLSSSPIVKYETNIVDHVSKQEGYTAIGVKAGDGVSESTLRTQINSFPIPDRKHYRWTLIFRLAGAKLGDPWQDAPNGVSPATIWQLKSPGIEPALVMAVDTNAGDTVNTDPGRLLLNFDTKVVTSDVSLRIAKAGVNPNQDISVVIDSFLDNRTPEQGGTPRLTITVNGQTKYDRTDRAVLQSNATGPYNWSIGAYLYKNKTALTYDRFTYWKEAKMEVCD